MKRLGRWFWNGRRRWISLPLVTLLVVGLGALVHLDEQHTFDVRTETFTFESGGHDLATRLHLPTDDGPHGLVVFVPGDGPAEYDAGILPVWEALADAGYATVQWDKPGVGDSTGNWLDQDMADRADEVVDAVAALEDRDDLDTADLGVIGTSQGGWVLPLVAERIEVDFSVAWSTAIDWNEQGDYFTERLLADVGPELSERVREANDAERGGTYQEYLDWYDTLDDDVADFFSKMSEDRWRFAIRNQSLDARDNLSALSDTPVLLLLGERDANVDIDDTERTYRDILDRSCLHVIRYPDGDHELLDRDGFGLTLAAILSPRSIFADGMLDDIRGFAASAPRC